MLRSGKIRYWGLSNFRGWRIADMVHLAETEFREASLAIAVTLTLAGSARFVTHFLAVFGGPED